MTADEAPSGVGDLEPAYMSARYGTAAVSSAARSSAVQHVEHGQLTAVAGLFLDPGPRRVDWDGASSATTQVDSCLCNKVGFAVVLVGISD
jgi:hypothetical protein